MMTTENLITLDTSNDVALTASLAALDERTRARLRGGLDALDEVTHTDALVNLVREVLDERGDDGRIPVGVWFHDHESRDDGVYLDSAGTILFTDGTTQTMTFTTADEKLRDRFLAVSWDFSATVDLRTGLVYSGDWHGDIQDLFRVSTPSGDTATAADGTRSAGSDQGQA